LRIFLKLTVNVERVSYEEVISGFHRDVEEIFTLRGSAMVNSYWRFGTRYLSLLQGSRNPKLKVFFLDFLSLEDGADRLSRNFDKNLPLSVA